MHNWNWDDLKYLLAVVEQKSVSGAARFLHVSHTTVLRRINAFELKNGLRLFERNATGSSLTETGEEVLQVAQELKATVSALERRLSGKEHRLEGRIRLTTCDTLMDSVIPTLLERFTAANPEITFDITTGNYVSVSAQRDADVAIRTGDTLQEMYYGRKACDSGFSVYATPFLNQQYSPGSILSDKRWVIPDITLSGMTIFNWIKKNIPDAAISVRADSLISLKKAAEAGMGFTILPHYLGDASAGLQRVPNHEVDRIKTGLWVLTHQDLHHSARIRTFMTFANETLRDCIEQ
ncbi:TPA: LysR family transcriptional regulator [Enterobacter asburiae]|jgi:DNA-binding transcriptional LysR family regulator